MGAKPPGVGPRVGRAGFPVRVPGAPPSPPRQECGRAAVWQPRGPPPRREETAARLSRGSRASQAMTIFQPLAPAGQALSLRSRPGSRRWPRRLDGRVSAPTASAAESPGGLRVGQDGEKSAHEATHRDRWGRHRVGLQRPRHRSALPTAAPRRRREPPVAGARAWGQPRVRAVQDAVALLLRVHELGDILQAQPAHHGCACGGAGAQPERCWSAREGRTRGPGPLPSGPPSLPRRRRRVVRVSPAAALARGPALRPASGAGPAVVTAERPCTRGRCAPAARRPACRRPDLPATPPPHPSPAASRVARWQGCRAPSGPPPCPWGARGSLPLALSPGPREALVSLDLAAQSQSRVLACRDLGGGGEDEQTTGNY